MSVNIQFDKENSTINVVTGSAAEVLHAQDVSDDQRRPELGDMEFIVNITAYTSGNIVTTLVGADNAALTTNAVVHSTHRTLTATGLLVIPVPQDLSNKDFIGILTTAVAHAFTSETHVQSTQSRQRGR